MNEQDNKPILHVYRTLGGTAFEVVTAIILLATWIINITGGEFSRTILFTSIDTVLCIHLLNAAYHPLEKVKMPINITTSAQLAVMVIYTRIIAVMLASTTIGMSIESYVPNWTLGGIVIIYSSIGIILATSIGCLIRVFALRDRSKKIRWRVIK